LELLAATSSTACAILRCPEACSSLKEIDRKTTKVYVNANGYTEAYENLCVAISRTIYINTAGAIEALRGTGTAGLMIYKQF
jgi:hypothetical protein